MFEQRTSARKTTEHPPVRPVAVKRERSYAGAIVVMLVAIAVSVGAYLVWSGSSTSTADRVARGDEPARRTTSSAAPAPDRHDGGTGDDQPEYPPARREETLDGGIVYRSCRQARDAGVAPMHRGDGNYNEDLDKDGDGVACETYYRSCEDVRQSGKTQLRRGEPGYRYGLDQDGDGIAC